MYHRRLFLLGFICLFGWVFISSPPQSQATTYPIFEQTAHLIASDVEADAYFGEAVAIDGDTMLISGHYDDDVIHNGGSAYVFVRSEGGWVEQAKLTASDVTASAHLGNSVAISGDTAVVSALGDNNFTGSLYVFVRSGTTWSQQAKLTAADGASGDSLGATVSIEGDTIVAGSPRHNGQGAIYVFVRSGTNWSQQAKLTASDGANNDEFSFWLDFENETIVAGARWNDDHGGNSGSAYIFVRSGTSWSEQAKLTASDAGADAWFGHRVAISGESVLVGAYNDWVNPNGPGSAYVFVRSGTSWSEQAKLTVLDSAAFGWVVALDGDMALISAPYDDGHGSAYIFTRSGTSWSEQEKLLPNDPNAGDHFSYGTALQNGTVVIGAQWDDTTHVDSGSVYVFTPIIHNLAVNSAGNGQGSVVSDPAGIDCGSLCSSTFITGTVVTLTAAAVTGSTFAGWSGDISSTANPITLTMEMAQEVTATFTLDQHELTAVLAGTGSGAVVSDPAGIDCGNDCAEIYDFGTVVTLTATADTGSTFAGWSGDISSTANPITLTMEMAQEVTATFTLDQHELTAVLAGTGSGAVVSDPAGINCGNDCAEIYDFGTVVTLTATADTGSTFMGWSGACSGSGSCVVTVEQAEEVTATFTLDQPLNFPLFLPIINRP